MIFLIHYNRQQRKLISVDVFEDRDVASKAKLQRELAYLRGPKGDEIVLLESESEEALRKTHRRYFESLGAIKSSDASGYSSAKERHAKTWIIRNTAAGWLVQAEGIPEGVYPTKESAIAAAAKDSRAWSRSTGAPIAVRLVHLDGSFEELASVSGV